MTFLKAKDPDALLDYEFDWTAYLAGDTIESVAWVIPAGLTNEGAASTDTTATIWLSGGEVGSRQSVVCRMTSVAGRVADRTLTLTIAQR